MRGPFFAFPFVIMAVIGFFFLLIFIFALIQVGIITVAFSKLGLTPGQAFLVLAATLIGSGINIPVHRTNRLVRLDDFRDIHLTAFFRHYRFPMPPQNVVQEQVVAVNVGGCVIPVLLSVYFLSVTGPSFGILAALLVVTLVCYKLARPITGVGIGIPVLIPPLVTALAVLLLVPQAESAEAAYIAGSLGTLIGADLLHLLKPESKVLLDGPLLSIGGAGTFDGIFLSGILAVLLA